MDLPQAYREWIAAQGHAWDWFFTGTFRDARRVPSAERSLLTWLQDISRIARLPDGTVVPCIYAVEFHRGGSPHVHAVLAGVGHLSTADMREARSRWVRSRGLAKLEHYDPSRDGLGYVVKSARDAWSLVGFSSEVFRTSNASRS